MGPEAKPFKTHWSRVCVYDVCSHDACVNPLDNLWCLHLSCHSAKCHMSFSFAFLSQCLFFACSYALSSSLFFLFDLSGVYIVLFFTTLSFWPFPVYESLTFLSVLISAFLTLFSMSVNVSPVFSAWRTISTPLVISDSGMCQASDFCDVNRPLILRLHRKTSQLYIALQRRSFALTLFN